MICFSIAGTRICIEFGFIAVCALLSAMESGNVFAYGLSAVILHEFAHLFVMTVLDIKPRSLTFHFCGIRICPEHRLCSYGRELAMLLAGPFANIAAWAVLSCFSIGAEHEQIQLITGIVNLLPCRRLDGGAALSCILSMTGIRFCTAERILRFVFIIAPVLLFVSGIFAGITNFTYYALALYLLFSEIFR
ncbi:MAG: hypothetical protein ACI4JD_03095 [Ruminococcus sp.]